MGMIVNCAAYEDGRRIAQIDLEQDGAIATAPEPGGGSGQRERFVWVGLHEPSQALLRKVQKVLGNGSETRDIERVHELRRELLTMRRAVAPLLEICDRLLRFDVPLIARAMHPYFRDLRDHVIRVAEAIDDLRELLTSAMETNLLPASVQRNDVMKRLAGWAAILAMPTAVFGLYGMNFHDVPELRLTDGYPTVLATVVVLCSYLYCRFKRAGWF